MGEPDSFCQLLDKYFPKLNVSNRAVPGSQIRSVWLDYDDYIKPSDDILIIAFGINDHSNGAEYLQRFEDRLEEVSLKAIQEGKQVVLVGFPQRNKLWEYEDPASTIAYNDVVEDVALKNGIPLVDIYSAFESMGENRQVIERIFGDFIHHPNGYGHRIYFSYLLPYFLEKPTRSTEIPEYIVGEWSDRK
ncbi:SGNH/GDSL hydrolase family protein [Altererythrobacter sp. SALINAS58]|uniref:SGNH/GDSL hydrolase family protein n=1 Tax=Alteripontixanthobacter muriae TaxID=2705546 RepID=UPI0015750610|nr:SGNH/GDSL hydrolase family protein [Alteripontixanthobacter muriae]